MSMRAEQHVFLSYPRRNEKEAAELRRVIEADGHVVWQDRSAIQGGDDWVKAIVAGLERAYAVVAVVSAAWSTSKWIRTEVLQAQRMNKTVIPVLVDDSEIPTELLTLHVISIYADQAAAGMESLLATLHAMRGRAGQQFRRPDRAAADRDRLPGRGDPPVRGLVRAVHAAGRARPASRRQRT